MVQSSPPVDWPTGEQPYAHIPAISTRSITFSDIESPIMCPKLEAQMPDSSQPYTS